LNPQDAISRERKTWPGRLRRNGQHLLQQHRLGTPGVGSCISRRPRLTRSLEDARYVHINFLLLADLVVFEQVKKYMRLFLFLLQECVYFRDESSEAEWSHTAILTPTLVLPT